MNIPKQPEKLLFYLLFFVLNALLTGCTSPLLRVETRYIDKEGLASYHVKTPDPHLACPKLGERLSISWSLPLPFHTEQTWLQLQVRLRNKEQKEYRFCIPQSKGTLFYDLTGLDYCSSGGIQAYKVEIFDDQQLIAEQKHPLWVNLIHLNIPNSTISY